MPVLNNYVVWEQNATAATVARVDLLIRQGGPTVNEILAEDEEMVRLKADAVAQHDSMAALSKQSPTDPYDALMSLSSSQFVN